MVDRTPRQELDVMARALATALGREFVGTGYSPSMPHGVWFIERSDVGNRFRLAERSVSGGINHPITSDPLTAQGLADALYCARRALEFDRQERRQHEASLTAARKLEFTLTIQLGNAEMQSHEDVAEALRRTARLVGAEGLSAGIVRDSNGNTVGRFNGGTEFGWTGDPS